MMMKNKAGEILGIEVYDHIIIGKDRYFSFEMANMLGRIGRSNYAIAS